VKEKAKRRISGAAYLDFVRKEVIGRDLAFETPFGLRNLFYADYTASGRGLAFIERRLFEIQKSYANTHTEDDYSGKRLTALLKQAEKKIKDFVNAGEGGKIIPVGSGSTGALQKLQEIIGVYIPPLTRKRLGEPGEDIRHRGEAGRGLADRRRPVVFIGPYEHHTNELMWREAFAEVVVVNLAPGGGLDLGDLDRKLGDRRCAGRVKFGSFSAGSNITGVRTPVYEVARICHRHRTPVFFDFAAVAPYAEIDMNRDDESYFDAVFFSPHKFLGGPGSSGVLIIREDLYRKDLPPTTAGGGRFDALCSPSAHRYSAAAREPRRRCRRTGWCETRCPLSRWRHRRTPSSARCRSPSCHSSPPAHAHHSIATISPHRRT
jgi:selenocysteine lyase/cysteine desulfurase